MHVVHVWFMWFIHVSIHVVHVHVQRVISMWLMFVKLNHVHVVHVYVALFA
jgi:hypothetical protein